MVAGCPLVVLNLWDVTDKDIDAFGMHLLSSTGVRFDGEDKDNGYEGLSGLLDFDSEDDAGDTGDESAVPVNLAALLPRARQRCKLRLLNGAAPVAYGVPVYLSPIIE
jgi:separase